MDTVALDFIEGTLIFILIRLTVRSLLHHSAFLIEQSA
ncbi:hypothetical protein DB29_00404 [Shouchella clausii]|nr:hypothetical protein DB29_00404 [Shouchella clausii]